MLKSKFGVNQVRIYKDRSKKGKFIRSLLVEVKNSGTMLMED
jgi:hypothetical protein